MLREVKAQGPGFLSFFLSQEKEETTAWWGLILEKEGGQTGEGTGTRAPGPGNLPVFCGATGPL